MGMIQKSRQEGWIKRLKLNGLDIVTNENGYTNKIAMCYLFIYLFPGWGGHDLMAEFSWRKYFI